MSLDLTSFQVALKEYYTSDKMESLVYSDNPFLALVPKDENFVGKYAPVPLIFGNPQGRSANFVQAQSRGNATTSKLESFLIRRIKDYSIATIDSETLQSSESDAGAFMSAAKVELDGAINSLTNSIAQGMYGSGYGDLGQIGSVAGSVITLNPTSSVVNFEVGMELVNATTQGASVLANSGASVVITAVDRSLGKITVSAGTFTTVSNYLFVKGDRQDSASPTAIKISGLEAWVPSTAVTSTPFFNVDRTQDSRLAGLVLDGSALPIEEALIDAASRVAREGGKPTHCFVSYDKFSSLVKALGAKVQYIESHATAEIGFSGISIMGPRGQIQIIPDRNCPNNKAYMLQLDTWSLMSLGKAVHCQENDGLMLMRQANADGVEARYVSYANLACKAPGWNIVIKLA